MTTFTGTTNNNGAEENESVDVLDNIVLFTPRVSIWSGRKKLRLQDLKLAGESEVPPETLASLGSKRIIDPNAIKIFETLKRRFVRMLELEGVRFLGGYAIPKDKHQAVAEEARQIQKEFLEAKDKLIGNYTSHVEQWIDENSEWEAVIRRAITPVASVEQAISFSFSIFKLSAADDAGDLGDELGGLPGQLFREIAGMAKEVVDSPTLYKDKATQRVLSPLNKIRKKLSSLSFLDAEVLPLVKEIDAVLEIMPKSGAIEGEKLSNLLSLMVILSKPSQARELARGLIVVGGNANMAGGFMLGSDSSQQEDNQPAITSVTPITPQPEDTPTETEDTAQPAVMFF